MRIYAPDLRISFAGANTVVGSHRLALVDFERTYQHHFPNNEGYVDASRAVLFETQENIHTAEYHHGRLLHPYPQPRQFVRVDGINTYELPSCYEHYVYGSRNSADILWQPEFQQFVDGNPNATLQPKSNVYGAGNVRMDSFAETVEDIWHKLETNDAWPWQPHESLRRIVHASEKRRNVQLGEVLHAVVELEFLNKEGVRSIIGCSDRAHLKSHESQAAQTREGYAPLFGK